ncbi:MAG: replicative DNA helicase [Anaerolineae bacterium]|nr:replicative DNA helicase [Anaerolineae bacterium]
MTNNEFSSQQPQKLAPNSQESEEAVLGSILINPEVLPELLAFLRADDFYFMHHRFVWEGILAVHERGESIDTLTVVEELRYRRDRDGQTYLDKIGGSAFITYLINNTPTHIHVETYARMVERLAVRRRLLDAASNIAKAALADDIELEEVIDRAEKTLFAVTEQRLRQDVIPMSVAVREYLQRMEELYEHRDEPMGLPTGFTDLDKLLGGFQKSDLIIVAARPGVGKTSFMLSIALNAARARENGVRVAIFSLEMAREQLLQRFFSAETGINSQKLRLGDLDEPQWDRFVEATARLDKLRIFLDDTPAITVQAMRTKCRRLQQEFGLDMVIVDYLQLMGSGVKNDNRVQEISFISRGLKELARELNVPVLTAAQLSRAVEQRSDKRPQLSDLRESGCLVGETLVYLPDEGEYVPIQALEGKTGFRVLSLNPANLKLESCEVTNAFFTGYKPVFRMTTRLGRSIRVTANHKFMTMEGWKRLDELQCGDYIATPRVLHGPTAQTMTDAELGLLGHLIGDGCTLPHHALQYTTRELDLAELVVGLANAAFPDQLQPRIVRERQWYQVYFPTVRRLTHGVRNPISSWLERLGAWGYRSYEKLIPTEVFKQPDRAIGVFLRHLWATDGCIRVNGTSYPAIYYASSSQQLAQGVFKLLLRLGINSTIKTVSQIGKGRDQYHVIVRGQDDFARFINCIGAVGTYKQDGLKQVEEYLAIHPANTNRDIIPHHVWRTHAVPAMKLRGLTSRRMQAELGNAYCGTGLYKQNISRERASRLAQVVGSPEILQLATSDVYWDSIESITEDGSAEVFDLTVPAHSNFCAENIIVHNSIEQDADIVMFIYRDDLYNAASETPNQAEILVSKHRNGPTGVINLYFQKELTQFKNIQKSNVNLSQY